MQYTKEMLNGFTPGKIYLVTGYTDLRRGIDGLAGIIENSFRLNLFEDVLFLFCGRRTDRIKGLYWDGNGFVLLYKRLEDGQFRWPRTKYEARLLTSQEYRWLLEGLQIEQPGANRPVNTDGLRFT